MFWGRNFSIQHNQKYNYSFAAMSEAGEEMLLLQSDWTSKNKHYRKNATTLSSSSPNCPFFNTVHCAPLSPSSSLHSTHSFNRFRLLQRMGESALRTAAVTKLPIKSMFNSHRSRPLTEKVEVFHLQRDTQRLLARKESRRISAIVTSCPIYFTERVLSLTLRRSEGPRNETHPARPLNCWSVCELGAKCTF